MREILFRGKRKSNGKWICGMYENEEFGADFDCIIPRRGSEDYRSADWAVIPETVGQYTGLTDKNGVKIFEGDILRGFYYPYFADGSHNYLAEVVWFENCPAFGVYCFKAQDAKTQGISNGISDFMEDWEPSDWEVIGNIHDNPELR